MKMGKENNNAGFESSNTERGEKAKEGIYEFSDDNTDVVNLGSNYGTTNKSSSSSLEVTNLPIRSSIGKSTTSLADFVNDHLPEVRFLTTACIGLLATYGIVNTPLFFRYRTVAEFPASFFRQRKVITGRLIKVWVDKSTRTTTTASTTTTSLTQQQSRANERNRSVVTNRHLSLAFDKFNADDDLEKRDSKFEEGEEEDTPSHVLTTYPIRCQIRHSSPMESLLSKSWYDWVMRLHPKASTLGIRPDEEEDELLLVEIAGVRSVSIHPTKHQQQQQQQSSFSSSSPSSLLAAMDPSMIQGVSDTMIQGVSNTSSNPFKALQSELEWLEMLAEDRPLVSCQLLGRRVPVVSADALTPANKRRIPGLMDELRKDEDNNISGSDVKRPPHVAIGRLYFRSPSSSSWHYVQQMIFPSDLALSMIRMGRAIVLDAEEGLVSANSSPNNNSSSSSCFYRLADTTDSVRDLQKDVAYVEQLHKAEYQAVAEQRGMWQHPIIRQLRSDIVTEVEFQTLSPWWKKAWRWMRGG